MKEGIFMTYQNNIDLSFYKGTERYSTKYIIENEIPVSVHYSNGEKDEGVYLKAVGIYNFLFYKPESKASALAQKSNVVKIEVMGDLLKGMLETRAKRKKKDKNNKK